MASGGEVPKGRGGRGAAILEAMRNKLRKPGESEESGVPPGAPLLTSTPAPSEAGETMSNVPPSAVSLPSTGRGALLRGVTGGAPPAAAGRAALLNTLKIKGAAPTSSVPPAAGRAALILSMMKAGSGGSSSQQAGSGAAPQSPPGGGGGSVSPAETPAVAQEAVQRATSSISTSLGSLQLSSDQQHPQPVVRKGESGKPVKVSANYIRLEMEKDRGVFEYEVKFQPPVDSKDERHRLINQQKELIGPVKSFDGICLYLPVQLEQQVTVASGRHPLDNSEVMLTITLKHKKRMGDRTCVQLYNLLFKHIMSDLKMVNIQKNYYDPTLGNMVPQHKLEIWPGYVTAVQEYEGGVMLCLEVSHKVLRTQTAYSLLKDVHQKDKDNLRANAEKALLGAVVLTRYNNKNYRVDDIDWNMSPTSTFPDHNGEDVSFMAYYKRHYGIEIKDPKQPMLINRPRKKTVEEQDIGKLVALVPELCSMTGLTDQMRADFKVMKDVALFTRITPQQRLVALRKFVTNVNNSPEASSRLLNWGLHLAEDAVKLEGRILAPEKLSAGKGFNFQVGPKADWGREITTNHCLRPVNVKKWAVFCVDKNAAAVNNCVTLAIKLAPKMGMQVSQPEMVKLANDRTETFLKAIRDLVNPQVQLVMTIMPTPRDDRYAAVKKLCCVEKPVPSQVINFKTISNEKKVSSVMQKVLLQINCKLGGELWACNIPLKSLMVIGVDVYHDPSRRNPSVGAMVASTNTSMSSWFSQCAEQHPGQELIDKLKPLFIGAIKNYYSVNHSWPEKILVFRDGLSDSQLSMAAKYEAEQFSDTFRHISADYKPSFGYIVVQKRINSRIFSLGGREADNPAPGTVLDHTVTKRDWFDFLLVSQHVGQGTVSPTHYIVVHDSTGLKPDILQKISYKLTHMYYNWPGTVRVPAPVQYAHKFAYQVGEHIHKEPSHMLNDRLFYL